MSKKLGLRKLTSFVRVFVRKFPQVVNVVCEERGDFHFRLLVVFRVCIVPPYEQRQELQLGEKLPEVGTCEGVMVTTPH